MGGPVGGLFGRERERALVQALLGAVSHGGKRALALIGEPGIGKTALLHDARALADDAGFLTSFVRAPAVAGIPHAPVLPMLEGIRSSCARARLDAPAALHAVIRTMSGEGSADADSLLPLVAEALDKIAARRPLGLFVDDFHRAARAGSDLLIEIARALDGPVALVISAPADAAWDLPMPTADLWIDRCEVRGLTLDAAAELARARLGGPLLPSVLAALTRVTLTNPLYLQEALREWVEAGVLTRVGGFIGAREGSLQPSQSLGALIGSRIASSDEDVLEVARTLAVLARDVGFDELLAMSACSADELVHRIARAVHAGIVVEEAGPPISYRTAHPMYERALLSALSPTSAGRLHQRVFAGLRERKQKGHAISAAQIATHAMDALEQPDDLDDLIRGAAHEAESARSLKDAAAWWGRAAERAHDPHARAEALRGQAAATVDFDAHAAVALYTAALGVTDPLERRDLLMGRARASRIAGMLSESLADLEEALAGAEGETRARILDEIALLHAAAGRLDRAEVLLEGLHADQSLGTRARVRVTADLGGVRYARGDPVSAVVLIEEAAGDAGEASALHIEGNLMWMRFVLGDWDTALRLSSSLIARADREGDLWSLTLPLIVGARVNAARGSMAVAIDLARRAARVAERLGCPADVFDAVETMVIVLLEAGKPEEAVEIAPRIPSVFEDGIESRPDQASPFIVAGEAFLETGDTVTARAMAEQARRLVRDSIWGVAVDRFEAEIRLRLRDREGSLRRVQPWLEHQSPAVFEQARVHEVAARALFLMGEREAGAHRADDAIAIYRALGIGPRLERFERVVAKHRPRRPGRPRSELPGGLTQRETEVLKLILQGLTNRQIADVLTLSTFTAKKHVENILAKAGVRRRAELLEFAARVGVTFEPFVAPRRA